MVIRGHREVTLLIMIVAVGGMGESRGGPGTGRWCIWGEGGGAVCGGQMQELILGRALFLFKG